MSDPEPLADGDARDADLRTRLWMATFGVPPPDRIPADYWQASTTLRRMVLLGAEIVAHNRQELWSFEAWLPDLLQTLCQHPHNEVTLLRAASSAAVCAWSAPGEPAEAVMDVYDEHASRYCPIPRQVIWPVALTGQRALDLLKLIGADQSPHAMDQVAEAIISAVFARAILPGDP